MYCGMVLVLVKCAAMANLFYDHVLALDAKLHSVIARTQAIVSSQIAGERLHVADYWPMIQSIQEASHPASNRRRQPLKFSLRGRRENSGHGSSVTPMRLSSRLSTNGS